MSEDWFSGDPPRGAAFDPVFAARLRELGPVLLAGIIDSADTSYTDYADLFVAAPRWPGAWAEGLGATLQVRWADGLLTGCWADDHLWDDVDLRSPTSLVVRGFRMSPVAAAEASALWFARELARTVQHETWARRGRVVAERWAVVGGPVLARRGPWWRRRGEPDVVEVAT